VVVQEVYLDGLVAQDGRLQPGDQIIEINGADMTCATHAQVRSQITFFSPRRVSPLANLIFAERRESGQMGREREGRKRKDAARAGQPGPARASQGQREAEEEEEISLPRRRNFIAIYGRNILSSSVKTLLPFALSLSPLKSLMKRKRAGSQASTDCRGKRALFSYKYFGAPKEDSFPAAAAIAAAASSEEWGFILARKKFRFLLAKSEFSIF